MKFINPSVEIWEQDVTNPDTLVEAMWAHIARCVRVCYQVDKPKNNETEEEYVKRVIFRNPDDRLANHYSVLEHGAVYLQILNSIDNPFVIRAINILFDSPYTKRKCIGDVWFFSTNMRVLVEHNICNILKYIVPFNQNYHYRRVTVSFITSLGIAREFNRHRVHSISEESTRYCNYSKDRFGAITFVKPSWITEEDIERHIAELKAIKRQSNKRVGAFMNNLYSSENKYMEMIDVGCTPQQAREVLPLCTKTQSIHTAFVDDWKEFFALRADGVSGPPHPDAEILAKPLKEEFINRKYI